MVQKSAGVGKAAGRTGRPRAFSKDAALGAAMRAFWTRGYEAASLELLELETGVSRSSLYNTFGSKRELFDQALAGYLAFLDQQLLSPLETGRAGLDDLKAFFGRLGMQLDGGGMIAGCLLTNSLVEFGGHDAGVVRDGRGYLDRAGAAILASLRRAAALGEIDAATVESRAQLLVGLVLSINLVARSGLGKPTFDGLVGSVQAQIDGWSREPVGP
jgi:TetR/AcrR family transcriptional regulator, transcriptional repressor for nem operon